MNNFYTDYRKRLSEIREQYPFLNRFGDAWAISIYQQLQEGQINEFVLSTVPADKTIEHLKKKFPNFKDIAEGTFGDINVVFGNNKGLWEVEELIKFMDSFGWFPSAVLESPTQGNSYSEDKLNKVIVNMAKNKDANALIIFEKKYNEQIEPAPFYHHISLDIYHDEIMKVGLIPRSHSKISTHPQRIYLLNPTSMEDIKGVGYMLFNKVKPEIKSKIKYLSEYRIDTSKVTNLEVYEDENFLVGDGAVWTQKNIPPSAIKHVRFFPPLP